LNGRLEGVQDWSLIVRKKETNWQSFLHNLDYRPENETGYVPFAEVKVIKMVSRQNISLLKKGIKTLFHPAAKTIH